jgi:hypothetical protein
LPRDPQRAGERYARVSVFLHFRKTVHPAAVGSPCVIIDEQDSCLTPTERAVRLSDLLQVVSLAAVVVALLFNYSQTREAANQAKEASRQVILSTSALKRGAYQELTGYGANFNIVLFNSGPDLLSWFLASRGIPASPQSHEENLRHMFMFVRMDVHESVFMSRTEQLLEDDVWEGWKNVIEADVATPEFRTVWTVAERFYAVRFAAFVNSLIRELDPAQEE